MKILIVFLAITLFAAPCPAARIRILDIDSTVNPAVAEYVTGGLRSAAESADPLVVIRIDTPGGLDSSMREIVKAVMASPVPVAAHVAPPGARAASAGAVICLSADFLAMAPGTNIGAAHPVGLGEKPDPVMDKKLVNDAAAYARGIADRRGRDAAAAERMVRESLSLTVDEAVRLRVADAKAATTAELLAALEGKRYLRDGRETVLRLRGAEIVPVPAPLRLRILSAVSNPQIAYLLMMAGLLGLFFELSNPGAVLPGVIGGISLLLALYGLQALPVSYAGILLILLALIFFIAEIKIVSHGLLSVAGIAAMTVGSLMLFDTSDPLFRLSLRTILPVVALSAGFCLFAVTMAVRAARRPHATGLEALTGQTAVAATDLAPTGKVFIHGEYWEARADRNVSKGERVTVTAVLGMELAVAAAVSRNRAEDAGNTDAVEKGE